MNARLILTAAAAGLLCACGGDAEREAADGAQESASPPSAAAVATAAVATYPVPQGCDLIPRDEVERLAGRPLQGDPRREGNGCWYYVAMDTTSAEWQQLRERAERARAGGMDERAIELYHPTRAGLHVEVTLDAAGERSDSAPAGWDEAHLSRTGNMFYARSGHVRVSLRLQQLRLPGDTVFAVAGRVRDRIPDGPILHPAADRSGRQVPGQDPCSVLTREEAEAVLGELVAAPVRARERTALADPAGKSCAYLTSGHHAFVVTPTWQYGSIDLNAARMVGGLVKQVADLPGIEGDTLEGPWDEAVVDLEGEILLRKGANALGLRYRASSTDAAGALRLAGPALRRLGESAREDGS